MRIYFTLLLIFLTIGAIHAQQTTLFFPLQKPAMHKFISPATQTFALVPVTDSAKLIPQQNTLPVNFYSSNLGVMCKLELKMEKQIKLPLRIRLGSKDQVDYMEGKYKRF